MNRSLFVAIDSRRDFDFDLHARVGTARRRSWLPPAAPDRKTSAGSARRARSQRRPARCSGRERRWRTTTRKSSWQRSRIRSSPKQTRHRHRRRNANNRYHVRRTIQTRSVVVRPHPTVRCAGPDDSRREDVDDSRHWAGYFRRRPSMNGQPVAHALHTSATLINGEAKAVTLPRTHSRQTSSSHSSGSAS